MFWLTHFSSACKGSMSGKNQSNFYCVFKKTEIKREQVHKQTISKRLATDTWRTAPRVQHRQTHTHTPLQFLSSATRSFSTKAGRNSGHDVSHSVEWASAAINSWSGIRVRDPEVVTDEITRRATVCARVHALVLVVAYKSVHAQEGWAPRER